MRSKRYLWLLVFITVQPLFSKKIIQSQVVATTKELVDGRQFVHTYQIIDGVKRQAWAIDGQSVDKAAYEDAILEAEKAERRLEREVAYVAQEEELLAEQRLQQGVMKKLLRLATANLKQQLARLEEYKLQPYIVFDEDSLTQEQFESAQQVLARAQLLLQDSEPALSEMQATLDRLEWYGKRMKKLMRDSIEQAVAQCDDTALLKKLLEFTA